MGVGIEKSHYVRPLCNVVGKFVLFLFNRYIGIYIFAIDTIRYSGSQFVLSKTVGVLIFLICVKLKFPHTAFVHLEKTR